MGIITWPAGNTFDRITSWKLNMNRGATTTIKLQSMQCYGGRETVKNRNKLRDLTLQNTKGGS